MNEKKEETKQKFYVVGNGKAKEVLEETFEKESKIERKIRLIQLGIIDLEKCKESLFRLKKYFYGDFKYNEGLQKVPDPNRLIQDAIINLETAIIEAMEIEINSV